MSTKTLRMELIGAVAMLLVAVLALSGSTYAWFASNNVVKAEGMNVQATAEGGLLISYKGTTGAATGDWASTASAAMTSSVSLYPTSTSPTAVNGLINSSWFHASANIVSSAAAIKDSYNELDLNDGINNSDSRQYYVVQTFQIKTVSSTSTASDLKVSGISVSGNSQTLSNSLRVAVACGDNVVVYAPVYSNTSGTTSTKVANTVSGGAVTAWSTVLSNHSAVMSSVLAGTIDDSSNMPIVRVYIWYEGEDDNSTTSNASVATTLDTLNVSVSFAATLAN